MLCVFVPLLAGFFFFFFFFWLFVLFFVFLFLSTSFLPCFVSKISPCSDLNDMVTLVNV